MRPQEAVGEQVDALLLRQPARVEHLDLARVGVGLAQRRVVEREVHSARPAPDAVAVDAERRERVVGRRARREHHLALAVEDGKRHAHPGLERRVLAAQPGVGGELGVVAADQRQVADPRGERRPDTGGSGRGEVHQVVAALGERLDKLGDARNADLHPGVERDLDLGDRREPAVDPRVRANDLDLVAGDAVLPQPLDRVADSVHRADAVHDEGDAPRLVGHGARAWPSRCPGSLSTARRESPGSPTRTGPWPLPRSRHGARPPRTPPQLPPAACARGSASPAGTGPNG